MPVTRWFALEILALRPFGAYSDVIFSVTTLIALLACLIPTTIGGLLSASVSPPRPASTTSLPKPRAGSAILRAVIFNALVIIALIPLALRGVVYRPIGDVVMLRRNLSSTA